jgi:glycosyltransferase involved in cell wall biosynthesis
MKILFLSDNFPPEVNAAAHRTYEHAVQWIKSGHEVTVITSIPNFPMGKVYRGYHNKPWQRMIVDGIEVVRVGTYITANQGFVRRICDQLSFVPGAVAAGLFVKADLVIATSPQFFTVWAGYALSVLKRRPWVFELRDLWPDSIEAVGAMRKGVFFRGLKQIELFLYRKAHLIVAVTDAIKANLVARGIDAAKICVIPNGVNRDIFYRRGRDEGLLASLGLKGKFVVVYIGTHGMAHGLGFIVSCLPDIKDQDIHFLFIGEGAEKKKVKEQSERLGLKNATFLDMVPKEEVARYMSLAEAALVVLKRRDTFKTVLPSKIFEAAGMGKPLLLGVDGQAREIVEKFDAGIYFEPENKTAFIEGLGRLRSEPKLYARYQAGCEKLARDFDRNVLAGKMALECVRLMRKA